MPKTDKEKLAKEIRAQLESGVVVKQIARDLKKSEAWVRCFMMDHKISAMSYRMKVR
jgi:hypothetical protein